MELRDYFEVIRKRKWTILFVSLCVILGYSIFFFTQSPSYTAKARILLRLPPEWQDMPVISMPSWDTRVSLIESKPVVEDAVTRLKQRGIDIHSGAIFSGLSIKAEQNTDFVDVYYTDNEPDRAIEVTQAITKAFLKYDRNNNQESLSSAEKTIEQEVNRTTQRLDKLENRLSNAREISQLSRRYRNHVNKLDSLRASYGKKHPKIKTAQNAVNSIKRKLRSTYREKFPERYRTGAPIEELLMDESNLRELERRVENVSTRLNEMHYSLDQVRFNKSLLNRSATVISSPSSTSVSYPTNYQTYGFVILAGLLLGITTGSFLEYINDRIVSKFDVHRYLGLPVLGSIPKVEEEELNLLENPMKTPLSERYHSISVVLEQSLLKKQNKKVILITSAVQGEGKSYTSLNLGVSLAREGEQVLLMDMDLRAPKIHKILGMMNSKGTSTVLNGELELEHTLN
ncbi:MAG: GumC family protein, partial [bacterium]